MASRPFECSYPGCKQRFDTLKHMKRHKLADPEHFYCKKCDIDCKDWEDLTSHKVEMMAPFLEGTVSAKDQEPKHIVCEFCGEDFKSWGGRKQHRLQMHKASQVIKCPNCPLLFVSAGDFIAHLERNECSGRNSRREFEGNIKHKMVLKQIIDQPDVVGERLNAHKALGSEVEAATPGLITDGSETQDQESGGVSLMDQEDEAQKSLRDHTTPDNILLPLTRQNLETWPRLPAQSPSRPSEAVYSTVPTSPDAYSMTELETSIDDAMSEVTSRRGGYKVQTESYRSPLSPDDSVSFQQSNRDMDSRSTSTVVDSNSKQAAWKTGVTSRALFPEAKPTPVPGDWVGFLAQKEEEASKSTNLFYSRWWDPNAPEYRVDNFWNPTAHSYCCPFPGCDVQYLAASDVEGHIRDAHTQIKHRCPSCFKHFRSHAGLVSHMENTSKCRIKQTSDYKKQLDDVTGGYLNVKNMREPKIYRPQTDVVKYGQGQPMNGVMPLKYTAKMPNEK